MKRNMKNLIMLLLILMLVNTNVQIQAKEIFSKIDRDELTIKECNEIIKTIKQNFKFGLYKVNNNFIIKKYILKKIIIGYWNIHVWKRVIFKKNGIFKVYNRFYDSGNSPEYSGNYQFEDNTILFKVFGSNKQGWQRCVVKKVHYKKYKTGRYTLTFFLEKRIIKTNTITTLFLNRGIDTSFK